MTTQQKNRCTSAGSIRRKRCGGALRRRSSRDCSGWVAHPQLAPDRNERRVDTFDEAQAAETAFGGLERVKRRRSYCEREVSGTD
jgi:hypothetical protein